LADLSFEIYLVQALIIVFFSDLFILFKNKFNCLYFIDKSGLIVFNNSIIALLSTLIIVVMVIFSSIVVSKTLDKLQRIKL
jgi:peptidoglycan/LPS O-acetylase OafA/YrhL